MSRNVLLCPTCNTQVPNRISMSPAFHVERYTCQSCGETTLRSELVVDKSMNVLRGGASNTFTIVAACNDANGSISPSGNVVVNYNGSQAFTITANNGWKIAQNAVVIDGVVTSLGSGLTSYVYTFSGVIANHTISVDAFDLA